MISNNPFIHLFKTLGKYYVFDVNKNKILNISEDLYRGLKKIKVGKSTENAKIKNLVDLGYFSSNKCKIIEHSEDIYLEDLLKNKLGAIILQITQRCNFRCKYCVYSGNYHNRNHEDKNMKWDIAKRSLDFLLSNSKDSEKIQIGFYGGEPLLEFDLIKDCVDYAKKIFVGKKINFNLTTNGSILNNEIVEFLHNNNIQITISIDGPKIIHDKNRKFANNNLSTHDVILKNIANIRKKYPNYLSKININTVKDHECDVNEINKYFSEEEILKDLSKLNSDISNDNRINPINYEKDFFSNIEYEKFKVILSIIGRLKSDDDNIFEEYFSAAMLTNNKLKFKQNKILEKSHPSGTCIPGATKFLVNVNGDFFPCDMANEISNILKIGNINDGFYINKIRKLMNPSKIISDECKNCYAFIYCDQCVLKSVENNKFEDRLSRNKKLIKCMETRKETEESFKDICTINELYKLKEELKSDFNL